MVKPFKTTTISLFIFGIATSSLSLYAAETPQNDSTASFVRIKLDEVYSFASKHFPQIVFTSFVAGAMAYLAKRMAGATHAAEVIVYRAAEISITILGTAANGASILNRMVKVTRGATVIVLPVACLLLSTSAKSAPMSLLTEIARQNPQVIVWMIENCKESIAAMPEAQFASLGA